MDTPVREALWQNLSRAFSNRAFLQLHSSWFAGLASRAGPGRMQVLARSKPARKLHQLLAGVAPEEIAPLIVRSEINLEQALSGLRLTLVSNISVPAGAMVLFNQLAPQSLAEMLAALPLSVILMPIGLVLVLLVGVIWYAYAGVAAARDLNHLLRLQYADARAERGGGGDEGLAEAFETVTDLA